MKTGMSGRRKELMQIAELVHHRDTALTFLDMAREAWERGDTAEVGPAIRDAMAVLKGEYLHD